MRRRSLAVVGALSALIAGLLVATGGSSASGAKGTFGTTRANAGPLLHSAAGKIHTKAFVEFYNSAGTKVIARVRLPARTEGRSISLTKVVDKARRQANKDGLCFPDQGCHNGHGDVGSADPGKVTVYQNDVSVGGTQLWKWTIWTKFFWDISGLDHYVHDVTTGRVINTNTTWVFDKQVRSSSEYYQWDSGTRHGTSHGAYHHMRQAMFSGPALGGPSGTFTKHEYPKNVLNVHFDSTFEWQTECCDQ